MKERAALFNQVNTAPLIASIIIIVVSNRWIVVFDDSDLINKEESLIRIKFQRKRMQRRGYSLSSFNQSG